MAESTFSRLTDDEVLAFVQYQAAARRALWAHLESLGGFARSEVLSRLLARRQSGRRLQALDYVRRGIILAPIAVKQAAALRHGARARELARTLTHKAADLRAALRM